MFSWYNVCMDTREEWRSCPLAPAHVFVSNLGRVKTADRAVRAFRGGAHNWQVRPGKVLSPWKGANGYLYVSIKMLDKRPKFLVSRLVASAFCEGFLPELTVNHIDGNKENNLPSNLEWVTKEDNTRHEWRTGLVNLRGENHPSSKLTVDQVRNIRACMRSGVSPTKLARAVGVSVSMLYKIKSGERWAAV